MTCSCHASAPKPFTRRICAGRPPSSLQRCLSTGQFLRRRRYLLACYSGPVFANFLLFRASFRQQLLAMTCGNAFHRNDLSMGLPKINQSSLTPLATNDLATELNHLKVPLRSTKSVEPDGLVVRDVNRERANPVLRSKPIRKLK